MCDTANLQFLPVRLCSPPSKIRQWNQTGRFASRMRLGIIGLPLCRFVLIAPLDLAFHIVALLFGYLFTFIVFGFDLVEPRVVDLPGQNRCEDANEYQVPQAFLPVFWITRHSGVVYYQTR